MAARHVEGATTASDVLKKHEEEFFRVANAKLNLLELQRKNVISDSHVKEIENADDEKARELLFRHLHRNADVAALKKYCQMTMSAEVFPKMQDLGRKMLADLLPEGAGQTSAQTGSQTGAQGSETAAIIPDIMDEYVEIKRLFVSVCTMQGSPTLDEVKDLCIDLIDCAFENIPRIARREEDIEKAKTWKELARIVCFHLSKWVSYEFFKKVVAHFQPALKSVKERLREYEDQLKPLLLQKLEHIVELQRREEVPVSMAELVVKHRLDADGLFVKDLIAHRDFLAQRLGIPEHLLQVLSWKNGSIMITYWVVRDTLPLAELALCREDVRAELTQHGVEVVYLNSHPSEHPDPAVDHTLQTLHLQRRTIVAGLDTHRQDLNVISLAFDLKDMGISSAEQCQKIADLGDEERRHEALLYTLLAHDGPDTYLKLVECMKRTNVSIATELQATFMDLMKSPGALSVIGSSQY